MESISEHQGLQIVIKLDSGGINFRGCEMAEVNQCFIQGCALILTALNLLVILAKSPLISSLSTNKMESHVFLRIKFDKPHRKAFHIDFTLYFRHSNG